MHILLVLPTTIESKSQFFRDMIQNIYIFERCSTLLILAGLTSEKHTVEAVEGGYKDINFKKKYDLVGITTLTPQAPIGYMIADEFRRRGVKVVIGGWHASALPEEAKQHADSVVIGEAEDTWPQLLNDFENGRLKPFYTPVQPVDPEKIPHPKFKIHSKIRRAGIQATRGCPNGCEYCSITNQKFRNKFRTRDIDFVIEEIASLPNKIFYFHDNSFTIHKKYTLELFSRMKELNKKFIAYGNIGVLKKDDEILNAAHGAGCVCWRIGFESINQQSLNDIGKSTNKVSDYITGIKKIHDNGAMVEALFMLGFDYDTLDIFDATRDFVNKSGIDFPYFNIVTPNPGTPLFDRFDRQGRILTKDWSKYDSLHHVVFKPKNMTPRQLLENTVRLRLETYTAPSSIRRMYKGLKLGYYPFLVVAAKNIFYGRRKGFSQKFVKENLKKPGYC